MADYKPPYDVEDDDDDTPIEEGGYKQMKDAVLFAIDISKSMLTPSGGDSISTSPALAALKCAFALMQQRIISNPNDMMGILLFGTEKSRFQDEEPKSPYYPHCYLLTDLDIPAATDVRKLKNLVESEGEEQDLLMASTEEVSMANVLFCANQIFTAKAPNFNSRRLFLVTDNDYPHAKSRDLRNSAAVRAKDLYDLGVTIELFPISHPDRGFTFDRSKFYNDIVYSMEPSDPDAPAPLQSDAKPAAAVKNEKGGITLLESLLSSIASRAAPRRAQFNNLPFEIGPGLKISVKGFLIYKRQEPKRTTYVYLSPEDDTAQIAVGSSTLVADDTARTVEKAEVRKAYKFGGETISFTPEELASIKNFGDPVLRIIGFKPASMIPMWANLKQSTFVYPSEEEYIGSTRVFSALYQKMLKDKKVALAWYIARRNATPALVALFPGKEQRSEEGESENDRRGYQTVPPGLWIKPLPFADDIRRAPDNTAIKAPDSLIDAMRTIIGQLQLPKGTYDPKKYPNPALQWFYRILQALALEEELPEKPVDTTLPRVKQIYKRAGEYINQWNELLEKSYLNWQRQGGSITQPSGATKRTQPAGTTITKKIKVEDGAVDLRKAYEEDRLGKLTVAQLKDFVSSKGIKPSGSKKQDLVDAVTQHFENAKDLK